MLFRKERPVMVEKRSVSAAPDRLKTVVVGEYSVGKTSLARRFANNEFRERYQSTVAASFFAQNIEIGGKKIIFQIWDTAGQERYRSLIPMYLRGSNVAFLVYDITNKESFKNLRFWTNYLKEHGSSEMQLAILGNKSDLIHNREVSVKEGTEFAQEHKAYFMEVSAKTGENVQKLFSDTGKAFLTGNNMGTISRHQKFSITLDSNSQKRRYNCCSGFNKEKAEKIASEEEIDKVEPS